MTKIETIQKQLKENSAPWAKTANRFLEEIKAGSTLTQVRRGETDASCVDAKEPN